MNNNSNVREAVVARAIEHLKKELDAIDLNNDLSYEEVVAIVKGFGAWLK
jgi:hypothetical protein